MGKGVHTKMQEDRAEGSAHLCCRGRLLQHFAGGTGHEEQRLMLSQLSDPLYDALD